MTAGPAIKEEGEGASESKNETGSNLHRFFFSWHLPCHAFNIFLFFLCTFVISLLWNSESLVVSTFKLCFSYQFLYIYSVPETHQSAILKLDVKHLWSLDQYPVSVSRPLTGMTVGDDAMTEPCKTDVAFGFGFVLSFLVIMRDVELPLWLLMHACFISERAA